MVLTINYDIHDIFYTCTPINLLIFSSSLIEQYCGTCLFISNIDVFHRSRKLTSSGSLPRPSPIWVHWRLCTSRITSWSIKRWVKFHFPIYFVTSCLIFKRFWEKSTQRVWKFWAADDNLLLPETSFIAFKPYLTRRTLFVYRK